MKELKRSTLMGMTKAELVNRIECLEHNAKVLEERFENLYEHCAEMAFGGENHDYH